MMKRLMVRIKEQNHANSQIWQTDAPLPIGHPARWVITPAEDGIRILDLRGKTGEIEQGRTHFISSENLRDNSVEKIYADESGEVSISIQKCSSLRAAYFNDEQSNETDSHEAKVWAYAGFKRTINASSPIHGAYIGYYELRPNFVVYKKQDIIQIKCLTRGLVIKEKGKPSKNLHIGTITELPLDRGQHVTIKKNLHWWKFQVVTESAQNVKRIATRNRSQEDSKRNKHLILLLGLFFLSFSSLYFLVPEKKAEVSLLPEPQIVKVLPKRSKTPKPGAVETQSALLAPEAAPAAAKAEASTAAAPARSKKIAPAPVPHPVLSQRQKANHQATSKADLLRKAFGGSRLLATSASLDQTAEGKVADMNAAHEVTQSLALPAGSAVRRTLVAEGVDVKQGGKVGSFGAKTAAGAKGAGFGYNTSESAAAWVGGTGHSFMNITGGGGAVDEGLSREEVARVIMEHMSEVRYCHEAAMIRNPKCSGKIVLHFVISKDGTVKKSEEESSTVTDKALGECILRRLNGWIFPKPRGGVNVNVSFPFLFKVLDDK